jgi:hypothetical protein
LNRSAYLGCYPCPKRRLRRVGFHFCQRARPTRQDAGSRAQDQYEDAANAVYNSLVKTYGHDIAFKAFKAGIGHQTNGQWDHSWNHPITGRHIQKMLSTAQKELKAGSN